MKLSDSKKKIFPKFAYIPVILVIIINCVAFWGTKFLTVDAHHYNFSTTIDGMLPFVPWFMSFYILAYAQWVWNYVYHTRLGREKYYHVITADLIAKLMALILFIFLPAQIARPQVAGDGFWDSVTRIIYSLDTPTSLLPSVHCLESWL